MFLISNQLNQGILDRLYITFTSKEICAMAHEERMLPFFSDENFLAEYDQLCIP